MTVVKGFKAGLESCGVRIRTGGRIIRFLSGPKALSRLLFRVKSGFLRGSTSEAATGALVASGGNAALTQLLLSIFDGSYWASGEGSEGEALLRGTSQAHLECSAKEETVKTEAFLPVTSHFGP